MKHYSFYTLIFFILTGFYACNNSNKNTSNTKDTTFANHEQIIDSFFLKIKGEQALIIPGKAIGILQVGERTDSIKIGTSQKSDAGMCKSLGRWFYGDNTMGQRKELDIFSECNGQDEMRPHVLWIRTSDPAFKTKDNIGIGSTLKDIQSDFDSLNTVATYIAPDSTKMKILTALRKGIAFEMTTSKGLLSEKDTCRAIIVHHSDRQVPAMYFSFYENLKMKK